MPGNGTIDRDRIDAMALVEFYIQAGEVEAVRVLQGT